METDSRVDDRSSLVGRTIDGKYEIEELVGQGAMGAVYRAKQTTLGTTVALKVLHRANAAAPMFAARFLREAQAASRVDHPSSIRIIDFGEEPDGLLYIAMEYVDGRSLAEILSREGPLPVSRIVDIASQALAALAVAHDLGVVHRDIKPENIMVLSGKDDEGNPHDIVKVCDFGVAKVVDPARMRAPSVTAEGLVVGTPEYMSPEQARGEPCDARSDVYSMGVLLFHLMTGKVPFDSSTAFGTALMHVTDEPTRPTLLDPSIDQRLEAICLKAMRKRPEDRHASARELRAALRALLDRSRPRADDADERSRNAMWEERMKLTDQIDQNKPRSGLVVAAVVAIAAVAGGSVLFSRGNEPAPVGLVGTTTLQAGSVPKSAKPEVDAKAKAEADAKAKVAEEVTAKAEVDAKAQATEEAIAKAEEAKKSAVRMPVRAASSGKGRRAKGHAGDAEALDPAPAPGAPAHGPVAATDPADLPLPVFPDPPAEPKAKAPVTPPPLPAAPSGGGVPSL